jgi:hypothetical protein
MINWILLNKEWLFSGLGLAIVAGLAKLLYSSLHRRALPPVPKGTAPSGPGQAVMIPSAIQTTTLVMPRFTSAVPTTVLQKSTTAMYRPQLIKHFLRAPVAALL